MEPPEPAPSTPPPKRRRRWLIVALMLVLVSVGWWNWPRRDARFVGTWVLVNNIGQDEGAYRFIQDGVAERYDESSSGRLIRTATYRWSVDWPTLRLQPWGSTSIDGTVEELMGFGSLQTRSFEIVRLTDQSIEVLDHGLQRTMTFERVQDPQ